jgi:hypothetical protein
LTTASVIRLAVARLARAEGMPENNDEAEHSG